MANDGYELYYWPIQGRGETIRLLLEDSTLEWKDVTRGENGMARLQAAISGELGGPKPFAPPILRHGDLVLSHRALIMSYLGEQLGLVDDASRYAARALELGITDFFLEVHDVHHPIAGSLYYDDQKPEAKRRSHHFTTERMPKYLGHFEKVASAEFDYTHFSLFQTVEGLRYAFPRAFAALEPKLPRLIAIHDAVAARPRTKAYLASPRRVPFSTHGLFRHYDELDAPK
jgi:glutathione S-transferase